MKDLIKIPLVDIIEIIVAADDLPDELLMRNFFGEYVGWLEDQEIEDLILWKYGKEPFTEIDRASYVIVVKKWRDVFCKGKS